MKTSVRLLAAGMALLAVVSTAVAQDQERGGRRGQGFGGRGGFGNDPSMLLRNEKIQKELELSQEQVDQLTKIGEESREAFTELRDLDREQRIEKMRELGEKSRKKVNEVLLPHQQDRLKELQVQLSGARALLQDDVAEKLNLSGEQKEKLGELLRGGRGQGRNQEGGQRPNFEERNNQAMEVLTAEQKEQFEKMKGKKADISMRDLFQGFGGQRGEGRGGEGRGGEGRGRGEGRAPRDA